MNIQKIPDGLKAIGLFLLHNLTAILFLVGLTLIVYAVFMWSITFGFVAAGFALIIISLILNNEHPG